MKLITILLSTLLTISVLSQTNPPTRNLTLGWDYVCNGATGYKIYVANAVNPVNPPALSTISGTYCSESNTPVTINAQCIDYFSFSSGTFAAIDVGNTNSYTVTNLLVGQTYVFAVTCYDTDLESDFSCRVTYTILDRPTFTVVLGSVPITNPSNLEVRLGP